MGCWGGEPSRALKGSAHHVGSRAGATGRATDGGKPPPRVACRDTNRLSSLFDSILRAQSRVLALVAKVSDWGESPRRRILTYQSPCGHPDLVAGMMVATHWPHQKSVDRPKGAPKLGARLWHEPKLWILWWARKDLNLRLEDYESPKYPFQYRTLANNVL